MPHRWRSMLAVVLASLALGVLVLATYLLVLIVGGGFRLPAQPDLAWVLVATTVVALAVQPAYRRIHAAVRQAVGLSSLPPFQLLRRLPESLIGELPAEDVPAHMVRVLGEGLRAHGVELWLRVPGAERLVAVWPPPPEESAPPVVVQDAGGGRVMCPVRYRGEDRGFILLEHRPPRALSRLEERLLAAYADQAGAVVTMLALRTALEDRRVELTRRAVALADARERLLDAQLVEQTLLERDLHDGAQQQLIALTVNVRLAQQVAARAPARATAILRRCAALAADVERALGGLSEGLYPRLLSTQGLGPALRVRLAGSEVPVVVDAQPADAGRTTAPEVAEAVFFVALEAVQNALKHAGSPEIQVVVREAGAELTLEVRDRGRGLDPDRASVGGGLDNMRSRVAATGGRLDLVSVPGAGTLVTVVVPLAAGPVTASDVGALA